MKDLARTARVLADPTRLRILSALMEDGATAASLAAQLGLTPERATRQLAILRSAGMVSAEEGTAGSAALWSADTERLEPALEALRRLVIPRGDEPVRSPAAAREVRRNSAIRRARTCYDHLGGVAAVALLDAMVARGWLVPEGARPAFQLTLEGARALAERGVELERREGSRRSFAFGCVDWTERRPHLGGALGAAVRRALEESGYLHHTPGERTIREVRPLCEWLND